MLADMGRGTVQGERGGEGREGGGGGGGGGREGGREGRSEGGRKVDVLEPKMTTSSMLGCSLDFVPQY